MSAITPTNIYQESVGSLKANIATFAIGATPGDTWTSSISGIMFAAVSGQAGTQTGAIVSCNIVSATSIITFGGGVSVTMPAFDCLVLSKSG